MNGFQRVVFALAGMMLLLPFDSIGQYNGGMLGEDELQPDFPVGVKAVTSFNFDPLTGKNYVDFSDTELMIGMRQKLYNAWRGQFIFGMQFPDVNADLGKIFYTQVFTQVENERNTFKLGRTNAPSKLIDFPTLRDDDAIDLNYSLNPFSNGINTEDNQYANMIDFTHIINQRYSIGFHADNYIDEIDRQNFSVNALGLELMYKVPDSEIWNRNVLQQVGLSVLNYLTRREGYGSWASQSIRNYLGSFMLNINPDPVYFWDFSGQVIYNEGFKEIDNITTYQDYTRTETFALFGALRFVYRKLEKPLLISSGGFGYKFFSKVDDTKQMMAYYNFFYRLGNNFDVGLQYKYNLNQGKVLNVLEDDKHRIQLALVFSFDKIFNSQFDDRYSILNLEHKYIK